MVALQVEEGRTEGEVVHYVAKIVGVAEDCTLNVSFLRVKSPFAKDTFVFPDVEDVSKVKRGQVKGVLLTRKGSTQRLANQVKLLHPLYTFTMR